jgi:hypothetical protein
VNRNFRKWLNQEILWKPFVSRSGSGKASYGDAESIPCYIVEQNKMVRNRQGQEVVSQISVYLDAEGSEAAHIALITGIDQIILPDDRKPPILSISRYMNTKGILSVVEINL